jgi:YARHG domain
MSVSRAPKTCMLVLTLLFSPAATVLPAAAQNLWSLSCGDLWYQRNAIFARNGYCFKTARALRVFGNASCSFNYEGDVPMSQDERQLVATIRSIEAQKGCQF